MKLTTFAERLNYALDKAGFPPKNKGRIQQLSEIMGLSHRGISKWINGESCPSSKKYTFLAKRLRVSEEWLKFGQEGMLQEQDAAQIQPQFHKVRLLKIEEVLNPTNRSVEYVTCNLPVTKAAFALRVDTEAMSPRFPLGTIGIFESQKSYKDGDFILVKSAQYPQPIFRQILKMGEAWFLNAHNPRFDRMILGQEDLVCGVLVQAIISFM